MSLLSTLAQLLTGSELQRSRLTPAFDAAEFQRVLEANLALRKAVRARRSQAATKGHQTRRRRNSHT